jgi:predicted membrane-bound spermidine synthase
MTPSTEVFRVGLAALLTGIAVPLLVQLFLLLRDVRRTTAVLDQRLDRTLTDLGTVVAELKHATVAAPPLAAQLAAAVPAVVAAIRAFRTGMSHDGAPPTHPHAKENLT